MRSGNASIQSDIDKKVAEEEEEEEEKLEEIPEHQQG